MARQAPPASASPETPDARPPLEIAGLSVDLAKLLGRRHSLFPFLTIEASLVDPSESRQTDRSAPLRTPFALRSGAAGLRPLHLSDEALQALVDRAWSRRERWRPFAPIAVLVESHDPDLGRSADLLQAYRDQNLLQPYYDSDTRDARFWAMLGLAADHVTFIELVRRVARTHPSSKVTTELLFLLDELVQGSRDTLLMLTSTDPRPRFGAPRPSSPRPMRLPSPCANTMASGCRRGSWSRPTPSGRGTIGSDCSCCRPSTSARLTATDYQMRAISPE